MSSFGEELRRERELRRITLREVADATKINLRYLEALDKNDFKHLPGGVFNRGFVRAYAEYIGVDPEQMVTAYLMEEQAQANSGSVESGSAESGETVLRGTASYRPKGLGRAPAEGSGTWIRTGVAVLLVTALIVGGVLVYLKFFGGRTAVNDAETTDLPTAQIPQVSTAATGPTTDSAVEAVPVSARPSAEQRPAADDRDERATRSGVPASAEPAAGPRAGVTAATAAPVEISPALDSSIQATIFIDRAAAGRLNCDNRQLELLEGMLPGTRLELNCARFLIVDADDGGALRIGWPGVAPVAPGEAGVPLSGLRIDVPARNRNGEAP